MYLVVYGFVRVSKRIDVFLFFFCFRFRFCFVAGIGMEYRIGNKRMKTTMKEAVVTSVFYTDNASDIYFDE